MARPLRIEYESAFYHERPMRDGDEFNHNWGLIPFIGKQGKRSSSSKNTGSRLLPLWTTWRGNPDAVVRAIRGRRKNYRKLGKMSRKMGCVPVYP